MEILVISSSIYYLFVCVLLVQQFVSKTLDVIELDVNANLQIATNVQCGYVKDLFKVQCSACVKTGPRFKF